MDECILQVPIFNYFKIALSIAVADHHEGTAWTRVFRKSHARYKKHGWNGMIYRLMNEAMVRNLLIPSSTSQQYTYTIPSKSEKIRETVFFSVIMPVYNVDPIWLHKAVNSVKEQWYGKWELCIVDDNSTNEQTISYLRSLNHPKIKIRFLDENRNISEASNEALKLATGEYIVLMDHDDELTVDALWEVSKVILEKKAEFVYSDEDKIEMDGRYTEPHFKPDFSPDMFLSQNYISHLCVIKRALIEKVGGFRCGFEGSQDYDLYLRVLEQTDKIIHIPKVLYHWRKIPGSTAAEFSEKSYAQEAGKKALEAALTRRGLTASVENGKLPGTYRIRYYISGEPLISIIIPFKDKPELLSLCINSILSKSTYRNYEIIGISNNSTEKETFDIMKRMSEKDKRIRFHEYNHPFNYSKINNYAVKNYARGEHIVLLNNDIEIITEEWLETLLEFSQRKEIGAVGAKLFYANDTIQHAGVILGIGGVAGHSHKYFPRTANGYFSRLQIVQNLSAVTGACLMVKRELYDLVGGLDKENLTVAFNDVDFCLKLLEKGYVNLFTPYCEAYHHESVTRGHENTVEKQERFLKETAYVIKRWSSYLKADKYYNENLTLKDENFGYRA